MDSKRKPSEVDWEKARAEYEAGDSFAVLGLRYGRSKSAIGKHALLNNWVRNAEPAIRAQLAERVAGIRKVDAGNPEKREAAIDAAVEARLKIIKTHQDEWSAIRALTYSGIADRRSTEPSVRAGATAKLKDARLAAHALSLAQLGERRAYNITADDGKRPGDNLILIEMVDNPYAE